MGERALIIVLFGLSLLAGLKAQETTEDQFESGDVFSPDEPPLGLTAEYELLRESEQRSRLEALETELAEERDYNGEGAIPGEPVQDYSVFTQVPRTSFSCADKQFPGYYADTEARCQAFHICEAGGAKHSFLCPGGSVFNQMYLVCDWWYGSVCDDVPHLSTSQQDLAKLYQKEGNQGNQILPEGLFPTSKSFILDTEKDNLFFSQSEFFQSAETGVPIRGRLENIKDSQHDKQDLTQDIKNVDMHTGNINSQQYSHRQADSKSPNNSSGSQYTDRKELLPSEDHKTLKNRRVVRKKQHNNRLDQKEHDLFTSRAVTDILSSTENAFRKDESTSYDLVDAQ